MLEELHVRNFALIDQVHVRFGRGMNILSGETGAGKSILIGALGLIFGAKGEASSIRTGCDETTVSALIRVDGNKEALDWLKERDIEPEEGTILIRRTVKKSGRGSVFLQNFPVTRGDLEEITACLFDLHGQHQHQSLLSIDNHRKLLDRFGGHEELTGLLHESFTDLTQKKREFDALVATERDQLREMDLLSFAVREIEEANLQKGEEEELLAESRRLSQHEKLFALLDDFRREGSENTGGALKSLRLARSSLEGIIAIVPELAPQSNRFEEAFFEIEDIVETIRDFQQQVQFSPERLEEVEQRLSLIRRLTKKYGNSISEVLAYAEESRSKLERMENWEEEKENYRKEISDLEKRVLKMARELSEKRAVVAKTLQREIQGRLEGLGMPKAQFFIDISRKTSENGRPVVGPYGLDRIEFRISPNLGEPPKPLRSIASGGEISRIMLAIKSVLAETDHIQSLIFDEIDAGIGGEIALAVGEHLFQVSLQKQVLCITHLASIAVRADTHIKVEKFVEGERTITTIRQIDGEEKIHEIARMLSGDSEGKVSLQHAEELLGRYRV